MSSHYNFNFTVELNIDLAPEESGVIEYLVGSKDLRPDTLPVHEFFKGGLQETPFAHQYRDFALGSYMCEAWLERNSSGAPHRRGFNAHLPGLKTEDVYERCLPLASWLASLSLTDGFAGNYHLSDQADFSPTLLFVQNQELFVGTISGAVSYSSGELLDTDLRV